MNSKNSGELIIMETTSVQDLVQRLRTCSSEERPNVAILLGKTRTAIAIKELTDMVKGRRRNWLRWYNYNDQLSGIEALGETMNPEIRDYLTSLKKVEIDREGSGFFYDENGQNSEYRSINKIQYLNVQGDLRTKLDHTKIEISMGKAILTDERYCGDEDVENRFKEIIETAIKKSQGEITCASMHPTQ